MDSIEKEMQFDTIGDFGDSRSTFLPPESLPVSMTDDYYSKYNSEYQDGVLTEIGNTATEIRDSVSRAYHQSRDSMTNLRDGMR